VAEVPQILDGDTVECTFNGETVRGVAILDSDDVGGGPIAILVETTAGVVLPDQRFPILLLSSDREEV
jgi:hypothetical protein